MISATRKLRSNILRGTLVLLGMVWLTPGSVLASCGHYVHIPATKQSPLSIPTPTQSSENTPPCEGPFCSRQAETPVPVTPISVPQPDNKLVLGVVVKPC